MKSTFSLVTLALLASSALAFAADAPQAPASPSPSPRPSPSPMIFQIPGACVPINEACKKEGFHEGGAKDGLGIFAHCMNPILSGKPATKAKKKPPKIKPAVVAACKSAIREQMKNFKPGEKK